MSIPDAGAREEEGAVGGPGEPVSRRGGPGAQQGAGGRVPELKLLREVADGEPRAIGRPGAGGDAASLLVVVAQHRLDHVRASSFGKRITGSSGNR
jgi:hypothetical protein